MGITVLLSGGMNSALMLAIAVREVGKANTKGLLLNHGQLNAKYEIQAAEQLTTHYETELQILHIPDILKTVVTDEDYWPPFKISSLLLLAAIEARKSHHTQLLWGVNKSQFIDDPMEQESSEGSLAAIRKLLKHAQPEFNHLGHRNPCVELDTPLIYLTEPKVLYLGNKLGVPWQKTRSCSSAELRPCGKCKHCVRRYFTFQALKQEDPLKLETLYVSTEAINSNSNRSEHQQSGNSSVTAGSK